MDYTFKAPSLAVLAQALAVLQQSGLVGANAGPSDMLGPAFQADANGAILFRFGTGRPAVDFAPPDSPAISMPAVGEVGMFYIAIRTDVPPSAIPFDPAAVGLIATSAEESAAVLGVWQE
jgi:hypothetical protein